MGFAGALLLPEGDGFPASPAWCEPSAEEWEPVPQPASPTAAAAPAPSPSIPLRVRVRLVVRIATSFVASLGGH